MLAHRLRRWPNINPALVQRLMFAALLYISEANIHTYMYTQHVCNDIPEVKIVNDFMSELDKMLTSSTLQKWGGGSSAHKTIDRRTVVDPERGQVLSEQASRSLYSRRMPLLYTPKFCQFIFARLKMLWVENPVKLTIQKFRFSNFERSLVVIVDM